ncbi:hypothetical protein R1sor_001336 [Riccia sorocarpa]|uniref:Uncharacterized protein n=1 Tax=Riccia sorocarpa TaxID=122646 RepID=A0ABD3H1M7_9MARC
MDIMRTMKDTGNYRNISPERLGTLAWTWDLPRRRQNMLPKMFDEAAIREFFRQKDLDLGVDTVKLNNCLYCGDHGRDICHECSLDFAYYNAEFGNGFQLPKTRSPEYPAQLRYVRDPTKRSYVGKRWLDLLRTLYPSKSPEPPTADCIRLPVIQISDGDTFSKPPLEKKLLLLFRQLQGLTSSQRYYWGNQARIMIEDYGTFMEAAVLYKEELNDMISRRHSLFHLRGRVTTASDRRDVGKANILSKFEFFLELNTLRSFWRTMEMTADAFILHVEKFDEEADSHVVVTEKAKGFLLQWIAQIFWSVQHAQFRLNYLRALQDEVYQRSVYPFYPVHMPAMMEDRDIHLIIAKLAKAKLHDLAGFACLFTEFNEAANFPDQMEDVNVELMASIDELSARFRMLEKVISAALLVASEDEVKGAVWTYKFVRDGREINSKWDDVAALVTKVHEGDSKPATPKKCSYLERLIAKENAYRQAHAGKFLRPPFTKIADNQFTKKMFDEFKSVYSLLYRDSIRKQWRAEEFLLLPIDVAMRRQHRLEVKKKKKKKPGLTASDTSYEQADTAEARSVPEGAFSNPTLLWEMGSGTAEKYVPPVIREKVKTRKQSINDEESADITSDNSMSDISQDEGVPVPQQEGVLVPEQEGAPAVRRSLDQLKKSDVVTRDLLWRKVKGKLKWSNLVQFLTRLGCQLLPQDGSKKKIVDPLTGRWTLLHRPHPGDECRADQRESYRIHIEDWLNIKFSDLTALDDMYETK